MQLETWGVKRLQCVPPGSISCFGQTLDRGQELSALAGEESIGGQACDRSHRARKFIG
jgi:hypothetical protein